MAPIGTSENLPLRTCELENNFWWTASFEPLDTIQWIDHTFVARALSHLLHTKFTLWICRRIVFPTIHLQAGCKLSLLNYALEVIGQYRCCYHIVVESEHLVCTTAEQSKENRRQDVAQIRRNENRWQTRRMTRNVPCAVSTIKMRPPDLKPHGHLS